MSYMAVIESNGTIRRVPTEGFTLEDFRREVGGWICTTGTVVQNLIAVVDDEGLLKYYTPNLTASVIAGKLLVGNVVFGVIKDEDIAPFSDEFDFEAMAASLTGSEVDA